MFQLKDSDFPPVQRRSFRISEGNSGVNMPAGPGPGALPGLPAGGCGAGPCPWTPSQEGTLEDQNQAQQRTPHVPPRPRTQSGQWASFLVLFAFVSGARSGNSNNSPNYCRGNMRSRKQVGILVPGEEPPPHLKIFRLWPAGNEEVGYGNQKTNKS